MKAAPRWYILEVIPQFRPGRGRYWRPSGSGYTDDAGLAGIYAHNHSSVEWSLMMEAGGHEATTRAIPIETHLAELEKAASEFRRLIEPCLEVG